MAPTDSIDSGPQAAAGEVVERPEPGLGRGLWEAPAWVFWLVASAALVGGLGWIVATFRSRTGPR